MNPKDKVAFIGVPMDLGGGLRGVDMGPSALRIAGIEEGIRGLGIAFEDLGNVPVPRPERRQPRNEKARFLTEISHCCARVRKQVERVLDEGSMPMIVGGDHSIAAGSIAGISSWYHRRNKKIGLIWIDAHGDMNTPETTLSGNIHGMPLAAALGYGAPELVGLGDITPMVDFQNTVLVGVHSIDTPEREMIEKSGIKAFAMRDIDKFGIHAVMEEAIAIATRGTVGFHLSFDIDGCDPVGAPGVGTPVDGGLTTREAHIIMEDCALSEAVLSLDLTEINPIVDQCNKTAELAKELALSALGKRVL